MEIEEIISKIRAIRNRRKMYGKFYGKFNLDYTTLYPNAMEIIDYPSLVGGKGIDNYTQELFNKMLNELHTKRKRIDWPQFKIL